MTGGVGFAFSDLNYEPEGKKFIRAHYECKF